MNKSNEYKKYFDNVSPDQELVNRTRNMMLSELGTDASSGGIRKISYKKYGMIAVCAAAAAVAIIASPKIGSSDKNSFINTEINNSAEVTSVSEKYNSAEITTAVTDKNGVTGVLSTSPKTKVSDHPLSRQTADNSVLTEVYSAVTIDSSSNNTKIPAVSSVPVSSEVTEAQTAAPPVNDETGIPSETVQADKPEVSVTVIPNFRPGVTSSSETTYISVSSETAAHSTDGVPDNREPSDNNDYVETVKAVYNGIEYSVNINKEYDYSTPRIMDKDSIGIQTAENYFGKDFLPSFVYDDKSSLRIFVSDIDDPGTGIYFVSGTQTLLSDRNSRFAAIAVSDNGTDLRYSVPYENEAVPTEIGPCRTVIWQLVQYDDVYICSYIKNGYRYDICFKGYSINEITEIIMN